MYEQKIAEFRELAEHGVEVPDLGAIEERGYVLRRRRLALAVGTLVLALVGGAGLARITADSPRVSPVPVAPPSPTRGVPPEDGIRTRTDAGENVLLPGRSTATYGGVTVRFDAPGPDWEWWDTGMGLRRSLDDPDEYAGTVFFLGDASARLGPGRDGRVQRLGSDPERLVANVAPLRRLAHATVLQDARVVQVFGGTAVHLRLRTDDACSEGVVQPQLGGVLDGSATAPAWPGSHVLDVWHVVLGGARPATMLVASWDLGDAPGHRAEQRALIDSLRIERG